MSLAKRTVGNMIWSLLNKFSTQGLNFVFLVILTRMILPSEFGLMGMIYVFIGIGTVLVEGGMTESLIRAENPNSADYSSVFYLNCILSLLVYSILYLFAPTIARFFGHDILIDLLRVLGLSFIISALSAVQNAILIRQLQFKRELLIFIPSLVVSGIIGITMAQMGFGVWSLIVMALVKAFLITVFLWWFSDWRPALVLDRSRIRYHFRFGSQLVFMEIVNQVYANIFGVFIGKNFSPSEVGYYTQGNTLKQVPVSNIYGAISKVAYPVLSSLYNEKQRLLSAYKRVYLLTLFLLTPIMVLMFIFAAEIIVVLFTEKWMPSLPYLKILCFVGVLHPLVSFNSVIFKVEGRSDLYLKLGLLHKLFITIGILLTFSEGIEAMLWSLVVAYFLSSIFNAIFLSRVLEYAFLQQMKDLFPILILNVSVGLLVYKLSKLSTLGNFVQIGIGLIIFGIGYFGLAYLFRLTQFNEVRSILKHRKLRF